MARNFKSCVPLAFAMSIALSVLALSHQPARGDENGSTIVGAAQIIDGNHLEIEGQRLCLWGMDSPDIDQYCITDGRPFHCGRSALAYLRRLAHGKQVSCTVASEPRDGCLPVRCATEGFPDIGRAMVWAGRALNDTERTEGPFDEEQKEARKNRRGLWDGQFDRPWIWREQGGMIIAPE